MADAKIEQKVTLTPTFINGSLVPAGTPVTVDMAKFVDEDGNPAPDKNLANLGELGSAPVLVPTPVAAIAPTGPNPTQPQQVPPGVMQTLDGYASGGALLVADGHPDLDKMIEGAEKANAGVEEEAVQRLSETAQVAGADGTNGSETGMAPDGEGKPFDGTAFVDRNIGDVTDDEIAALSPKQLDAVIAAEREGKNRTGLLTRLGVTE